MQPSDITGFIDNKWFSSLSGMGTWVGYIIISMICLFVFYYLWLLFEHNVKVTWFPAYGIRPEDIEKIRKEAEKKGISLENLNSYGLSLGHPKHARGKDTKEKGTRKFSLIFPPNPIGKKLKELDYKYRYPDGVWFIKLTKDDWIPIYRPIIDDAVKLKVPESDMDLWQEAAESEIRRRTQDEKTMQQQIYMTAAIILGAFALSAIIIWLSMNFAGNSINGALSKMDGFTNSINSFLNAKGPG